MKKVPNRNSSLPLNSSTEDLKKTNSKLVAEIFIKNKIIHDLNIENSWKKGQEYSQDINYGRLFTVLQKFKVDLEKAYSLCEENSLNILGLEKQKLLVQEENSFLWSIIKEASLDAENYKVKEILNVKEPQRLEELESKLKQAESHGSELKAQITYWTNVSKKSQEAKLIAEASNKVMEKELKDLKNPNRTSQKIIIDDLESQLQEKEEKLLKHLKAEEKIQEFSKGLEDAMSSAEKLEKENVQLKENLHLKEKLIVDLKEQLSLLIEKDENLEDSSSLKEKYDKIIQENQNLNSAKGVLATTLDNVNKKFSSLQIDNQRLSEKFSSISEKVALLEDELIEMKKANQKLTKEKSISESALNLTEKEIDELKESIRDKESIIKDLKSALESKDVNSLSNISQKGENEQIQSLEKCLSESTEQVSSLKMESEKAHETINLLKKDLLARETEVNDRNETIEVLNDKISKLESASFMIDEKDKQLIELLSKCEKSYSEYEKKSEELEGVIQESKMLKEESILLKKLLQEKTEALETHNLDIEALKTQLDGKEEAIQHFILQYGNLEQKNIELEKELATYQNSKSNGVLAELEALKERNILLEEQLNEMIQDRERVDNSSSEIQELKLQEKLANQALDVLQKDLSESKQEIKRLESMLKESQSEQELLQKKIQYYNEKLEKYEQQLETADEIVAATNSTNSEFQNLKSKLESSEGRNKILENELVKLAKQLESTMVKLQDAEEKASYISKEDSRDSMLEIELEQKIQELIALENEHKNLGNLFSILKAELDAKDSDSKKVKQSLDTSLRELEEQKKIVNSMREDFETVAALKNASLADKQKIAELQKSIHQINEKNSNLENTISVLEKAISEMKEQEKGQASALEEEISRLEKEIQSQISLSKKRESELKELQGKYASEKQESESLAEFIKQSDIPSLLIRVGFLEKQSAEYETKLSKETEAKSLLESRLAESEALIAKLQEDIAAQDGNVFHTPQVLIEKQQKIDELTQFNEALLLKIEKLSQRLAAADSARPTSLIGASGLESVIAASQKQAKEAESAIEALSFEVSQAYEKINALVKQKEELEEKLKLATS